MFLVLSKAEKTKVIFNLTRNSRVEMFKKKLKQRLNSKCLKDPLLKKGLRFRFTSDGSRAKKQRKSGSSNDAFNLLLHSECEPKITLVTLD